MKRALAVFVLMGCVLCLACASEGVFLKDIGIEFGHGNFLFDRYDPSGVGLLTGAAFGLTERLELDAVAMVMLTPRLFGDASIGCELGFCLLGERVFNYDNAGLGINSMVSIGIFANNHNPEKVFLPSILTLRVTPLTVGSPRTGRRERLLPMGLAWNFHTGELSFFFSAFIMDFYVADGFSRK